MPYGPGSDSIWAEATAQAKKMGYTDFRQTSAGHTIAARIADAIARKLKKEGKAKAVRLDPQI